MAGDHRAEYKNKVTAQVKGGGGLFSAWVYRPNHVPALQAYFQACACAIYIQCVRVYIYV